ncbi:hypothetical protein QBE55_13660 [Eubacteriales bacterium mix99]|mgnify:CR=1 FL=1
MKDSSHFSYMDKIRRRIRILWLIVICMLVYMVVIGETGGGDSRIMTPLAQSFSSIAFFGGLAYVFYRIHASKKLLSNKYLLKEQMRQELDERNQFLHDKSGGIVVDILMLLLLSITLTSSMYNMTAFYMSFSILLITGLLKTIVYFAYQRNRQ